VRESEGKRDWEGGREEAKGGGTERGRERVSGERKRKTIRKVTPEEHIKRTHSIVREHIL